MGLVILVLVMMFVWALVLLESGQTFSRCSSAGRANGAWDERVVTFVEDFGRVIIASCEVVSDL